MKLAYVVFARNKAPWIAECVKSILGQTYSPMEIFFSDQGSEDDTLGIIKETVNGYNGPNKVHVLQCPETEPRGMAGLLAHINWLHNTIDGPDFWITCSADDFDYPNRAKRTVETIREVGKLPLYFGTAQHFLDPDLSIAGITPHPAESKWVDPIETIEKLVGGSCSGAWAPQLLQEFGPLQTHALTDVFMPFCAALRGRFYYLREFHHAYVNRKDKKNTGIGGRRDMSADKQESKQWDEVMQFELSANLTLMAQAAEAMQQKNPEMVDLDTVRDFLYRTMLSQLGGWVSTRQYLTDNRIPPIAKPA